jgi:hypothetical protein
MARPTRERAGAISRSRRMSSFRICRHVIARAKVPTGRTPRMLTRPATRDGLPRPVLHPTILRQPRTARPATPRDLACSLGTPRSTRARQQACRMALADWRLRATGHRDRVHMEQHARGQSWDRTRIVKFFLHLSKGEQCRRFLARIDDPDKNWKFGAVNYRGKKILEASHARVREPPWRDEHEWLSAACCSRGPREACPAGRLSSCA